MITQTIQEYKNKLTDGIILKNTEILNHKLSMLHDKLENEITVEDIENLNPEVRGYPNYLKGTFDENGVPCNPVMADAYDNIVLGLSRINLIEGGVRAGKDVIGLALAGDLFMLHPASTFGVLGISLEHAIQTVFNSDGFGFFSVIPHGRLTRENIDGAQRVVYRFKNFWGIEKKIVIYGNSNKNDWEKYHGFSIGAWYINEGINQVVRGIEEADQRMIQSPMPVMVITQNPEGPMNSFYTQFEAPRLPKLETIETIKEIQEYSKNVVIQVGKKIDEATGKEIAIEVVGYKGFEEYHYKKMHKEIKKQFRAFLLQKQKPSYDTLDEEEQVQWNNIESRLRFMYEKHLRTVLIKDIFDGISENHPLADKSWKKVVHYKDVRPNPNGILNNVDFSYYHITMEQNESLTEEQKAMARYGYIKGSSIYLQKIMGVRKAVDSAVLDSFGEDNVFHEDINKFKILDTKRYIVIDFGAGKASGIADYECDLDTGAVWQTREKHITPEYAKSIGRTITDELIYDEFLKMLKDGKKNALVIIDNANLHLKNYFRDRGINPLQADKRYEIRKGNEIQKSFDGVDVDKIGLQLLNLGFSIKMLHVHNSCTVTINQLSSYEYDSQNEVSGKVNVVKVDDEFCDTYRYMVSTVLKGATRWYKDGEAIGQSTILYDDEEKIEKKKSSKLELQSRIQQRIAERGRSRFFGNRGFGLGTEREDRASAILKGDGRYGVGTRGIKGGNPFKN